MSCIFGRTVKSCVIYRWIFALNFWLEFLLLVRAIGQTQFKSFVVHEHVKEM